MSSKTEPHCFGPAENCKDIEELVAFLKQIANEPAQKAATAYGMILAARSVGSGPYRKDTLKVLDALSLAKAKMDSATCHTHPTIDVTNDILISAQVFTDEATAPCTEWPTPEEVIENVVSTAIKYGDVDEWQKWVTNRKGVVVGIEDICKEVKSNQ